MTPKTDIHNYARRYESSKRLLENADISRASKNIILKFDQTCALDRIGIARRCRIINTMRAFALTLPNDLDKVSKDELKDAVLKIELNENWTPSTKHTHKAIIKKFYKWLAYGDDYKTKQGYPEIVSWMRSSVSSKEKSRVNAADILTESEVEKLVTAAEYPRDKAFISMIYELGARIGEIGSLRIKDLSRDKHSFIIDLCGKTGHRTPRIVVSDPYLTSWLNIHPQKDDPDASLWIMLGSRNKNRTMKYSAFRALVLRLKERAKIKKRIYPHLFRHTRVTHLLLNKQINEAQAKVYFGWVPSSRMLSEYSHLASKDVNYVMLEMHGIEVNTKKNEPKIKQCPRCKKINPAGHSFCKDCGSILDIKSAMNLEDKRKGFDDIATPLLMDEGVKEAMLKAMLKNGFGEKLLETWKG